VIGSQRINQKILTSSANKGIGYLST